MSLSWCKVASNLDSHPRIRRAGRDGREVFLFALRRNAEPGHKTPGRLKAEDLDADYLADLLMMPRDAAVTGVRHAVTAGLLREVDGFFVIVGWEDGWGKTTKDGAERTKAWRERQKIQPVSADVTSHVTSVTSPNVTRDAGDGCDALEETRREEKKRETRSRGTPLPDGWQPDRTTDANQKAHTAARTRGVDLHAELEKLRDHAKANPKFNRKTDWDATWRNWIRNAKGSVPLVPRQGEFRERNQIA